MKMLSKPGVPKGEYLNLTKVWVAQSCPTRCDPMDCSHQAPLSTEFSRQEYWSGLSIPFSRGSFWPRDRTQVSCIAGRFFTNWGHTREALELHRHTNLSKLSQHLKMCASHYKFTSKQKVNQYWTVIWILNYLGERFTDVCKLLWNT